MYPHQADRLNEALERAGVEALVATSPESIAYVTGFRSLTAGAGPREQYGVFSRRGTALVVPAIDAVTVVADAVDVDHVVCFDDFHAQVSEPIAADAKRALDILANRAAAPADGLVTALEALGVRPGPIGLEESRLTPGAWQRVIDRLGHGQVTPAADHLLAARRVKGPYEIECLARALRITEEALNAVIQMLGPGVTEREAVRLFTAEVINRDAMPVPALIAFGARTAIPASGPTERALRRGDLVRMEVGCTFKGYHASVARMAVMDAPTARQETAYGAIQAGLEAAIAAIRPGLTGGRLCEISIAAAREAGLPGYGSSQLGHGVGLEPSERPQLAARSDTALETGEVLQLEAPYYELGWAGLDVKDTVIVTVSGARVLNGSTRGLVVLD